jgi:hypothetical protein
VFFIVNKTKGTIVISDIGVTLGPRQAIDLDKLMNRSKSESSKFLKKASRNGQIDIRVKDGGKTSNAEPKPKKEDGLDEFKKEMMEEMKQILSQQSKTQQHPVLDKGDLADFAQQIIKSIPKQETVIIQGKQQEIRTDEDVEMNEDLLADINARAVDKIVDGSEIKSLNYKEEQQENSILDNIDELEGLL